MKYLVAVLLLITLGILIWSSKKWFGDIRPAVMPSSENIVQKVEQQQQKAKTGEKVDIPLKLPQGYEIGVFAKNLGRARNLEVSQAGTVLVSNFESIKALSDPDGDGIAEAKEVIRDLDRTHGFAFYGNKLYVTEETKVTRFNWDEQNLKATKEKDLFDLPVGGNHFTRTIVFDSKGTMYVSIGSTCNVCVEKQPFLTAVIVSNAEGKEPRLFAKGLRNSVALAVNPATQELWSADNGRDRIGDKLPPEEVNVLKDGKDYGWPYCYGERVHDKDFDPNGSANRCDGTEPMVFGMPAHTAPLGMVFVPKEFNANWEGDLLVAQHGSWNSSVPVGYKVVRLDVEENQVKSEVDFLSGFLQGSNALGRPVDVTFGNDGALYISDDKAEAVYKVIKGF